MIIFKADADFLPAQLMTDALKPVTRYVFHWHRLPFDPLSNVQDQTSIESK